MAARAKDDRNLVSVTTILADSQPDYLDGVARTINDRHQLRRSAKLTRSHLLRALIAALADSGLDLTNATTEDELRDRLARAMSGKRGKR